MPVANNWHPDAKKNVTATMLGQLNGLRMRWKKFHPKIVPRGRRHEARAGIRAGKRAAKTGIPRTTLGRLVWAFKTLTQG